MNQNCQKYLGHIFLNYKNVGKRSIDSKEDKRFSDISFQDISNFSVTEELPT